MTRLSKAVIFASALTVAVAPALAGPVEDRQELMKSVKKSLGVAVPMAKGEVPFDAAEAKEAMRTINSVPDKFVKLFPEGSDKNSNPDTQAPPEIWENMQEFLDNAEYLEQASAEAIEAADKGHEAFRAALFGPVAKACKNCHETYRIKIK